MAAVRILYLLRHAKPVAPEGRVNDFERPLSSEGKVQAEQLAKVLAKEDLGQACILSSPAVRAKETTNIVLGSDRGAAKFDARIYDAEITTLLDLIREVDDTNEVLILVGHNPGMERLLRYLTNQIHPMPTAALAKVILEIDSWRQLDGAAHLEWLITP